MALFALFRAAPEQEVARGLYRLIVEQARRPEFYTVCGVADTPDGRFDLIVAHAVLVLRRLHRDAESTRRLSQALFDLMFADMDQNLREMGVGDLAVGKRVKAMAKGFYGRLSAYEKALDADDQQALAAALRRNLYRNNAPSEAEIARFASYFRREAEQLAGQPLAAVAGGRVVFGAAPAAVGERLP